MRGFVYVAPPGYRLTRDLKSWIRLGIQFVSSLPKK